MNQIWTIILAKLRIARHEVAGVRNQSKLKVGVITVSATVLWIGAFVFFYKGFEWLVDFGGRGGAELNLGDLLMARLLSILTLAIFLLLIFSNALVSFSTLYRSQEVAYLIQAPIRYDRLFFARFFECAVFSSWSLAFLGSPLMLAYGLATDAPFIFYSCARLFFALDSDACIHRCLDYHSAGAYFPAVETCLARGVWGGGRRPVLPVHTPSIARYPAFG